MDRTKLSYGLFVLLLLCLGIAMGFWVTGLMTSIPSSRTTTTTGKGNKPATYTFPSGWCCRTIGSKCTEEQGGALACLDSGGKMFNKVQRSCDSICVQMLKYQ